MGHAAAGRHLGAVDGNADGATGGGFGLDAESGKLLSRRAGNGIGRGQGARRGLKRVAQKPGLGPGDLP